MKKLLIYLKPLKKYFVISFITAMIGALSQFAFLNQAALLILGNTNTLLYTIILMSLLAFLIAFGNYGEHFYGHELAFRILCHFRNLLYKKVAQLSPAFLNQENLSDVLKMMTKDIDIIEVFYAHTIIPLLKGICYSLLLAVIYATISWQVAILVLASCIVLGFLIPYAYQKRLNYLKNERQNNETALNNFLYESIDGKMDLYHLNQGKARIEVGEPYLNAFVVSENYDKADLYIQKIAYHGVLLLSWVSIIVLTFSQGLNTNQMALIIIYPFIFQPLASIANLPGSLTSGLTAAKRLLNILEQTPSVSNGSEKVGRIEEIIFDEVTFTYPNKSSAALKNLSVNLDKRVTGIIGKNGSGKSTLAQLIMHIYEVDEGTVFINQSPIDQYSKENLYKEIKLVQQTPKFFPASLKENLTFGHDFENQVIYAVLEQMNLLGKITQLDRGLNTTIDPNHLPFSSGELQRLELARALLHQSSLLILDEPASHLDGENTHAFFKQLLSNYSGRILLITHQMDTLKYCNEIYNLNDGYLNRYFR
jgi:ABC-type transport system involved in cytochrome bd biosynthesis fused ATPase/permease subunit